MTPSIPLKDLLSYYEDQSSVSRELRQTIESSEELTQWVDSFYLAEELDDALPEAQAAPALCWQQSEAQFAELLELYWEEELSAAQREPLEAALFSSPHHLRQMLHFHRTLQKAREQEVSDGELDALLGMMEHEDDSAVPDPEAPAPAECDASEEAELWSSEPESRELEVGEPQEASADDSYLQRGKPPEEKRPIWGQQGPGEVQGLEAGEVQGLQWLAPRLAFGALCTVALVFGALLLQLRDAQLKLKRSLARKQREHASKQQLWKQLELQQRRRLGAQEQLLSRYQRQVKRGKSKLHIAHKTLTQTQQKLQQMGQHFAAFARRSLAQKQLRYASVYASFDTSLLSGSSQQPKPIHKQYCFLKGFASEQMARCKELGLRHKVCSASQRQWKLKGPPCKGSLAQAFQRGKEIVRGHFALQGQKLRLLLGLPTPTVAEFQGEVKAYVARCLKAIGAHARDTQDDGDDVYLDLRSYCRAASRLSPKPQSPKKAPQKRPKPRKPDARRLPGRSPVLRARPARPTTPPNRPARPAPRKPAPPQKAPARRDSGK